ncbi:MAG: hypothetical protein ACHREM_00005 [Polyangiales bacterium]
MDHTDSSAFADLKLQLKTPTWAKEIIPAKEPPADVVTAWRTESAEADAHNAVVLSPLNDRWNALMREFLAVVGASTDYVGRSTGKLRFQIEDEFKKAPHLAWAGKFTAEFKKLEDEWSRKRATEAYARQDAARAEVERALTLRARDFLQTRAIVCLDDSSPTHLADSTRHDELLMQTSASLGLGHADTPWHDFSSHGGCIPFCRGWDGTSSECECGRFSVALQVVHPNTKVKLFEDTDAVAVITPTPYRRPDQKKPSGLL